MLVLICLQKKTNLTIAYYRKYSPAYKFSFWKRQLLDTTPFQKGTGTVFHQYWNFSSSASTVSRPEQICFEQIHSIFNSSLFRRDLIASISLFMAKTYEVFATACWPRVGNLLKKIFCKWLNSEERCGHLQFVFNRSGLNIAELSELATLSTSDWDLQEKWKNAAICNIFRGEVTVIWWDISWLCKIIPARVLLQDEQLKQIPL